MFSVINIYVFYYNCVVIALQCSLMFTCNIHQRDGDMEAQKLSISCLALCVCVFVCVCVHVVRIPTFDSKLLRQFSEVSLVFVEVSDKH